MSHADSAGDDAPLPPLPDIRLDAPLWERINTALHRAQAGTFGMSCALPQDLSPEYAHHAAAILAHNRQHVAARERRFIECIADKINGERLRSETEIHARNAYLLTRSALINDYIGVLRMTLETAHAAVARVEKTATDAMTAPSPMLEPPPRITGRELVLDAA